MAVPVPGHLVKWKLEPDEIEAAFKLNDKTVKMLETANVELAEALAEFQFAAGGDSGVLLNSPDFWMLRGRRSWVLEMLGHYDDVMGLAAPPAVDNPEQLQ